MNTTLDNLLVGLSIAGAIAFFIYRLKKKKNDCSSICGCGGLKKK